MTQGQAPAEATPPAETAPRLGTNTVLWDLAELYHGADDPQFLADQRWCRQEATALTSAYGGRVRELAAEDLAALLQRLEALEGRLTRLATFTFLDFITRTGDEAASARQQLVEELAGQVGADSVFFELEWNLLPDDQVAALLSRAELAPWHHHLRRLRRHAPHQLSQAEERLWRELAPVGRASWLTLFEKVLGQMRFGPQGRTEEEVLSDLHHPERERRSTAAAELAAGLTGQSQVLCHICNTLAAEKMIADRLRAYPGWLSARNLDNEVADSVVETMVAAVRSRYDIVQRHYRAKGGLLGLTPLYDYDRYAPVPGLETAPIPWDRCRETILASFAGFSPRLAELAEQFFTRPWIHAPLAAGKRGGAFAHPCLPELHPYLMVNYAGTLDDVSTVAHEVGHGVHQLLAARQGLFQCEPTLFLAETASVFAELLLFQAQVATLTGTARRAFICRKLESIFATVFRQVAMHRFEALVHTARRDQGELSLDKISRCWLESQQEMFGDSLTLTPDYAIAWSYIPHFLATPGYVHCYAFAELLVLGLYARYLATGEAFVADYFALLAAGGSAAPDELLAPFGIRLDDPSFWQAGLDHIDRMGQELWG